MTGRSPLAFAYIVVVAFFVGYEAAKLVHGLPLAGWPLYLALAGSAVAVVVADRRRPEGEG